MLRCRIPKLMKVSVSRNAYAESSDTYMETEGQAVGCQSATTPLFICVPPCLLLIGFSELTDS